MARRVPLAANPLLKGKIPVWRSRFVMGTLAVAFIVLAGRVVWLQVLSNDFLKKQGEVRFARNLELPANRGKLFDRNGVVLASSLPAKAIWAIPDDVNADARQRSQLAALLQMSETELKKKLSVDDKNFVFLRRQVDAEVAKKIADLKLEGIHQRAAFKRYYPEGESIAHVVGFTGVEDEGLEGLELSRQKDLAGKSGSRRVIKDRLGRVIEDLKAVQPPYDGKDLTLALDTKIQFAAFNALKETIQEHKAKAGSAIVMDVVSGEILALANWPTYNPNQRQSIREEQLRNRSITDTFEPGSTIKPFTAALAIEAGLVRPQTSINTAPGKLTIGKATIGDTHPHGVLTVEQIVQKSSNVGTVKISDQLSSEKMWEMFTAVGFGQVPNIGFPGAVAGKVHPYKKWRPIEKATMSYGYGLSTSLVQLARAYSVFARDGDMVTPSLYKQEGQAHSIQVFKPETARAVRKMLEMAVENGGTAPASRVEAFRVAGKTGTARKRENGEYATGKYISSFVGFAPVSNPKVVVAVMVDEPSNGRYYGGDVAAPMFSKITGDALRALGVSPDAPYNIQIAPVAPLKESIQ